MKKIYYSLLVFTSLLVAACNSKVPKEEPMEMSVEQKAESFATFKLTTDLSVLTEHERQMLPLLFKAAKIMDDLFWKEAYGDQNEILAKSTSEAMTKFIVV